MKVKQQHFWKRKEENKSLEQAWEEKVFFKKKEKKPQTNLKWKGEQHMQGVKKFVEQSNKNVRLSFLCKFFFDHFSRFPNFFVQMIIFFFVDYYNSTVCNVNNLKFDKFPFISNYYKPFFLFVKNKNTKPQKNTDGLSFIVNSIKSKY